MDHVLSLISLTFTADIAEDFSDFAAVATAMADATITVFEVLAKDSM